jgi:hypothetical protein
MASYRRALLLGLCLAIVAQLHGTFVARPTREFVPFVQSPLPQQAQGDFDGDGRVDVAAIKDDAAGRYISITLSGSAGAADWKTAAAVLIKTDIDHDGDLDLVAVTPTGELVILINDGRGRFTRQAESHPGALSHEAALVEDAPRGAPAVMAFAPSGISLARIGTSVIVTKIRPPTDPRGFELRALTFRTLRAPPVSTL